MTIAPCRSSSTASQPAATASQIRPAMYSNTPSSQGALGAAEPAIGISILAPAASARSMKAPIAEPVPL